MFATIRIPSWNSLTIRVFSVIYRTFVGGRVLPLNKAAVCVFYSPQPTRLMSSGCLLPSGFPLEINFVPFWHCVGFDKTLFSKIQRFWNSILSINITSREFLILMMNRPNLGFHLNKYHKGNIMLTLFFTMDHLYGYNHQMHNLFCAFWLVSLLLINSKANWPVFIKLGF